MTTKLLYDDVAHTISITRRIYYFNSYLGHLFWNMTIKIGSANNSDDMLSSSSAVAAATTVVAIDVAVHNIIIIIIVCRLLDYRCHYNYTTSY